MPPSKKPAINKIVRKAGCWLRCRANHEWLRRNVRLAVDIIIGLAIWLNQPYTKSIPGRVCKLVLKWFEMMP